MTDTAEATTYGPGDRVRWSDHPGVAFYVRRPETEATEDTWWDGIEEPTGRLIVVMVGDDREWSVEPADLTPLDDDDYCAGCGQIGCGHGGAG